MSEPFLGDIKIVAFNFAPRGYAKCDGQILPINQNQSLYSLLGTMYGGDGRTTFALPDMRGRTPLHFDSSHPQGEREGETDVALTSSEIPDHTHQVNASTDAATASLPAGNLPATVQPAFNVYGSTADANANAASVSGGAGNVPHNNMQPFLTVDFIIALTGTFPSRN